MPPKATDVKPGKTFSEDVVAAVLMANNVTSISMKNYEIMSSLDGTKTASAFQHDFRSVLSKAKELKKRVDQGEAFVPVTPASKRGGGASTRITPGNSTSKAKGASSAKRKGQDASGDQTPTKKSKGNNNANSGNGMMGSIGGAVQSPYIKPDPEKEESDEDVGDNDVY